MCDACEKTEFGCCIDQENAARGPNFEGCPDDDTPAFVDCATTVSTYIHSVFLRNRNIMKDILQFFTLLHTIDLGTRLLS